MAAGSLLSTGDRMMSIAELYALQETDLELAADRSMLADVRSRLGDNDELSAAQQLVSEHESLLRAAEKHFKEEEYEADELRKKIEPVERKLYTGTIQNPKELADLQMELESFKRRRNELEDKALAAMDAQEEAQTALDEARAELSSTDAAYLADQTDLQEQQTSLETNIATLEARREEQAGLIDGSLLKLYDQIAASHNGRGVAKIEGGACQGCRLTLPQNIIQKARGRGNLVQCSSCERILYLS